MSYDIRKNDEGETLVIPLELPMFNSSTADLGRQAEVCLASFLRHAAVCDYIATNLDVDDPAVLESYNDEYAQAASQITNLFMSLSGMADNLQIDIMQEIWEMPWQV